MLLDKPSKKNTEWFVTSTPETDFAITESENELIVHPIQPMLQGVLYTLSIYQREIENTQTDDSSAVKIFSFSTTSPPFVSKILPTDSMILPSEDLKITFKQPMDTKSVEERFSVIPEVSHTFKWNTPHLK
jgi:hypothetical protein